MFVQGLMGAPQHNGKRGSVVKYLAAKGRYEIQLEGETNHLSLRPSNVCEDKTPEPEPGPPGAARADRSKCLDVHSFLTYYAGQPETSLVTFYSRRHAWEPDSERSGTSETGSNAGEAL